MTRGAMASSGCWKCLSRPSLPSSHQLINHNPVARLPAPTAAAAVASFSTTAVSSKSIVPSKVPRQSKSAPKFRTGGTFKLKKKVVAKSGKPPLQGERKAIRKRIVLSNTNALEVEGMTDLTGELVVQDGTVGKVFGLPGTVVDSLRASEAFKITQAWQFFRRPALLVRQEGLDLSRMMVDAETGKQALRFVIDGGRSTGKSLMLVHAMTTAFLRGWIVLNIPEAQELVNASTAYTHIKDTEPRQYTQNTFTAAWLGQIGKANNAVLQNLKVSQTHTLPFPLQADTTLARLCELGARDPEASWPVFQAFWSEITSEGRPPVLLSLDSLSQIMQHSAYLNPDLSLVHSHDLMPVKHFVDQLAGTGKMPNGGAILAATSRSHAPVSASMNLAIAQQEDRQVGRQVAKMKPFEKKYDARAEASLQNMRVLRLKGLTKLEARGLMEYWAASGVLRARVDEAAVAEKWVLAGNGIVGEIERGALRMRI